MFWSVMDTSPVQSGSKCNSDFSIERILSSESVAVPEWLCCTRYRPPRLPRAVNGAGGGDRRRRAGRHARVPFSGAQAAALEAAYARAPYLAPPALRALAAALQLRDDRIKIWFQNRRARERREKSGSIAPPAAVTLPPTTVAPGFMRPSWTNFQPINFTPANEMRGPTQQALGQKANFLSYRKSPVSDSTDDDTPESDTPLDIETIED